MDFLTCMVVLDLYSFAILCVLVSALIREQIKSFQRRIFETLVFLFLLSAVFRLVYWLISSRQEIFFQYAAFAVTSLYIISAAFAYPVMIRYLYTDAAGGSFLTSSAKTVYKSDIILSILVLLLVIVNIIHPVLFTFDSIHLCVYLYGIHFVHAFICLQMIMLAGIVFAEKDIHSAYRRRIAAYCIVAIMICIFEPVSFGLSMVQACTVTGLLLIYMNYQLIIEKELETTNLEISRAKISLLFSKMKSDFLFSRMDYIHDLCLSDASKAQYAISELSEFIRGNIDHIDSSIPVPIKKELDYTRHYVNLMKMQYSDLDVYYDIQNTDISVPYKTIQRMTECAVNDSIENNAFDREICISSYLENGIYNVEISCTEACLQLAERFEENARLVRSVVSQFENSGVKIYLDDENTVHAIMYIDADVLIRLIQSYSEETV